MMNRSRSGNNPWSGLSLNSKSIPGTNHHLFERLQSATVEEFDKEKKFQSGVNKKAIKFQSSSNHPQRLLYKTPSIQNVFENKLGVPLSIGGKMKSVTGRSTANLLAHRRRKATD